MKGDRGCNIASKALFFIIKVAVKSLFVLNQKASQGKLILLRNWIGLQAQFVYLCCTGDYFAFRNILDSLLTTKTIEYAAKVSKGWQQLNSSLTMSLGLPCTNVVRYNLIGITVHNKLIHHFGGIKNKYTYVYVNVNK